MVDKLTIKIRKQNRNSLLMRPVPGGVEVFIPHFFSEDHPEVQRFIEQGLPKIEAHIGGIPPEKTSREQILGMVADYAKRMNVQPTRVQLREMKRKWGSCSSRGSITLNAHLTWLEPRIVEYVVCHELAHLVELNHSPQFWAVVAQHMPDYEERLASLQAVERILWDGVKGQ